MLSLDCKIINKLKGSTSFVKYFPFFQTVHRPHFVIYRDLPKVGSTGWALHMTGT